jgi:hypothetical protein
MGPAGAIDRHERQGDSEPALDVFLRETVDERGGQHGAERAAHGDHANTVTPATRLHGGLARGVRLTGQACGILDDAAWCDACTTHARDPLRVVFPASKDATMEALRWWLLLLTALMFSMSGCAASLL